MSVAATDPTGPSDEPGALVITGMMGSGKTTVAALVAEQTGRRHIDLDEVIESAAGASVRDIFALHGEEGFRRLESEAVEAITGERGAVISTGGWTLSDDVSRRLLEDLGPIVCLRAAPAALEERLIGPGDHSRPVLGGEVTKSRLAALTAERQPVYDSVPLQVETTGRPPAVVAATVQRAATVAAALPRRAISVSTPRGGYGVVVGAGALDAIGALLAARDLARHVVVVADESVNALYGAQVARAASEAGARTARLEIRGGERSKSPATLADVYDALLAAGTERASTVLALGGGVVGDVAGFAAATFMRGVPLVQVPTTLLAMVDSSIGGKTGVNLPGGKNLVGAFKHPELVLADTRVLRSLPRSEIAAGLAEVVKAAVIGDPELLSTLERGAPGRDDAGSWAEIVSRAATVKARIVSQDPEEEGVRAVLNLGHTFGHALEIATGHRLAHGPAVAIGLVAASRLATRLGLAEPELGRRLERLLMILGLPVRYSGPSPEDVVAAMQTDKKRADGRLRFAVPTAVGQVTMVDAVPMTAVTAVVADLRAAMAPYD